LIGPIGVKSDRPSMNLTESIALTDISKRIGSALTAGGQLSNTSAAIQTIHSGRFKRRRRSWTATAGSSDRFSWISYVRFATIASSPSAQARRAGPYHLKIRWPAPVFIRRQHRNVRRKCAALHREWTCDPEVTLFEFLVALAINGRQVERR